MQVVCLTNRVDLLTIVASTVLADPSWKIDAVWHYTFLEESPSAVIESAFAVGCKSSFSEHGNSECGERELHDGVRLRDAGSRVVGFLLVIGTWLE